MAGAFDAFVIFAEMRTGSNHLEETLNALPDVTCYGEVFNPTFIGRHNRFELLGFDMDRREREPVALLDAVISATDGLAGFRFFHDHDPRVLGPVLSNARIAKVILTRNPLDSYVSRKIAAATGQWRMTDLKNARTGRAVFDAGEFAAMLENWSTFAGRLERGLQTTGQTAFRIRYEDINDVEILNGLARFLGSAHHVSAASRRLKRQNPGSLRDKVENYDEMAAALSGMDAFGLDRVAEPEGARAPGVPRFAAHPEAGLLFIPVRGAPEAAVLDWIGGIGGAGRDGLIRGMSQRDLRKWMRTHPGFVCFSVLRHPVPRAFAAYSRLASGRNPDMAARRKAIRQRYKVPFPGDGATTREAFLAFLAFLKGNLAGQTSLPTMPGWATQMAILQAASQVVLPRRLLWEEEAGQGLDDLVRQRGIEPKRRLGPDDGDLGGLAEIYDETVERAVFDVYRRDYVHFGFGPWRGA